MKLDTNKMIKIITCSILLISMLFLQFKPIGAAHSNQDPDYSIVLQKKGQLQVRIYPQYAIEDLEYIELSIQAGFNKQDDVGFITIDMDCEKHSSEIDYKNMKVYDEHNKLLKEIEFKRRDDYYHGIIDIFATFSSLSVVFTFDADPDSSLDSIETVQLPTITPLDIVIKNQNLHDTILKLDPLEKLDLISIVLVSLLFLSMISTRSVRKKSYLDLQELKDRILSVFSPKLFEDVNLENKVRRLYYLFAVVIIAVITSSLGILFFDPLNVLSAFCFAVLMIAALIYGFRSYLQLYKVYGKQIFVIINSLMGLTIIVAIYVLTNLGTPVEFVIAIQIAVVWVFVALSLAIAGLWFGTQEAYLIDDFIEVSRKFSDGKALRFLSVFFVTLFLLFSALVIPWTWGTYFIPIFQDFYLPIAKLSLGDMVNTNSFSSIFTYVVMLLSSLGLLLYGVIVEFRNYIKLESKTEKKVKEYIDFKLSVMIVAVSIMGLTSIFGMQSSIATFIPNSESLNYMDAYFFFTLYSLTFEVMFNFMLEPFLFLGTILGIVLAYKRIIVGENVS